MNEAKYFEEIVKEIKNVKKYNLKDLMYAKYNKKYSKEFFTYESSHNRIETEMQYYGILIKNEDSYFDIINNISVNENEIVEKNTFDEDIELSLDEIKNALAILEEKFDLFVDEKIVSGDLGEGSYEIIKFRASKGLEKTKEELYEKNKSENEQKKSGLFGSFFKR